MLDEKIREIFSDDNFIKQFKRYKLNKTDKYRKKVLIPMGVDGVAWRTFEENIKDISSNVCKRAINENYFFSSFRELEVPKPPYIKLKEAKEAGKTRILSIATIKDVIFQKLFYMAIEDFCEDKFNQLDDNVNYAYRRGKSAPMAVRKIHRFVSMEKYEYVLDADLKKFFDEINHELLLRKISKFFGEEQLTITYLKRFFSADRTPYSDYKGNVDVYYSRKPLRVHRDKGIPQGGVLSGLVANIFLFDFDNFIVSELTKKYNNRIKYVRYADDFVVLFQNKEDIKPVYIDIKMYLENEKLTLHDIGNKTKVIDMSEDKKEKLEFLGYKISPKAITVKKDNLIKFKRRISEIVNQTIIYKKSPEKGLKILVNRISYKILGNIGFEDSENCPICGFQIPKRNWLNYFLSITDVRKLRSLDIWIRKQIYKGYYHKTQQKLSKKELMKYELPSLEMMYYQYKKDLSSKTVYCMCDKFV
ncbi:reverse transcriptase domain-containing protein [Halalkalibacter urbisdiaboli]|uniref:reverse transcriptase domain-containing protein n=1 Tax=Halalkalibacter urbisdiaboli TaxID=1960589 RepID=UPI001056078D|nr:reverse transcriptase domain-containing protein [Halalkalibacter urbisdiaboli]